MDIRIHSNLGLFCRFSRANLRRKASFGQCNARFYIIFDPARRGWFLLMWVKSPAKVPVVFVYRESCEVGRCFPEMAQQEVKVFATGVFVLHLVNPSSRSTKSVPSRTTLIYPLKTLKMIPRTTWQNRLCQNMEWSFYVVGSSQNVEGSECLS